jgi:hypothetical protein
MDQQLMNRQQETAVGVNRREFLKILGLTAAAATATGAGAATLAQQATKPAPLPELPPLGQLTELPIGQSAADLLAHLASAQAENRRLQTMLEMTRPQLDGQRNASAELALLRAELDTANQRVSVLVGLLALYEQMNQVNVRGVWEVGLTAVSHTLSDMLADVPWLREGLATGRQALQEMEAHIPLLQNGRFWLEDNRQRLRRYYEGVRALLETAVEASGSFIEMLNAWFQELLKWLPFGLGRRAGAVMQSLADLLAELPFTLSGLDTNVAQPLAFWLDGGQEETPLKQRVIRPLQAQALERAELFAGKSALIQPTFEEQLRIPVTNSLAQQELLRQQIHAYRQRHSV